MAHYRTIQSNYRPANGRHASADQIGSLVSSMVAGLAMFGLAANGMCLARATQSGPGVPTKHLANLNQATQPLDAKLLLVIRDESRLNSERKPPCQR